MASSNSNSNSTGTLDLPTRLQYFYITQELRLRPTLLSFVPALKPRKLLPRSIYTRVGDLRRYSIGHDLLSNWVRDTFWLARCPPPSEVFGLDLSIGNIDRKVLVRDGKYVAAEEQVYLILCRSHAMSSAHTPDERRSTHELVLSKFTHISPQLITAFVEACPTCNSSMATTGSQTSMAHATTNDLDANATNETRQFHPELPGIFKSSPALGPDPPTCMTGPSPSPLQPSILALDTNRPGSNSTSSTSLRATESQDRLLLPAPRSRSSTPSRFSNGGSHAMSREVSLYRGMPNGWQYHAGERPVFNPEWEDGRVEVLLGSDDDLDENLPLHPDTIELDEAVAAYFRSLKENFGREDDTPAIQASEPRKLSKQKVYANSVMFSSSKRPVPIPRIPSVAPLIAENSRSETARSFAELIDNAFDGSESDSTSR